MGKSSEPTLYAHASLSNLLVVWNWSMLPEKSQAITVLPVAVFYSYICGFYRKP